jgi:hypothetical protein
MPMLMLQCKTCGEVFPGIYVAERSTGDDFKTSATNAYTYSIITNILHHQ